MCGMWLWYTMALYMVHGLMWQCVVCDCDTLWHSMWSMVSCDNVWYVTVIHYGSLYGPWSHVTKCGMWLWYTMALYMVHGLMWQCVVCDCDTLWHSIWSMQCGLMWQCVVCDRDTLWHSIWSMQCGLMWQCVVCDRDTLWHSIWSMVSCNNVWYVTVIHYGTLYGPWSHVTRCGMWSWYTMALYMVHGLMWQGVVCDRDTLWHSMCQMVSCDNMWYVTVIHYGTLYGPWSHVTRCGMWPWYTMALYVLNGLMWQCVVYDRDTLWHTIRSVVSCDNVWYVTVIHYGTLYGLWSHVTMCGMWPWYTMALYMVHGLMLQYVVCDRVTLWHSMCQMVSCDNVWYVTVIHYGTLYGPWSHVTMCGMWPWYTMALYMVHGLMLQCVVCDRDTLWHSIWSMVSCDNVWYVTVIHYGTQYGPWSRVTLCGMWPWFTMALYMVHGLMWQGVVCDRDTLWYSMCQMVSCDNIWYVTVIHYGTLYGPWSHVTIYGMWPWYTMVLYMVHGLMWQGVVCDRDTL